VSVRHFTIQYFPCSHSIRFSIRLLFSFSDVRDLFWTHLISHGILRSSGHLWLVFESRSHPRKMFLWICCILFFAFEITHATNATISTFRRWIKVHPVSVGESGVTHPQSLDYNLVSSRECLCAVIFLVLGLTFTIDLSDSCYRDSCFDCFGFSMKDRKRSWQSPCFHLGWLLRTLLSPLFLIRPCIFGCNPGSLCLGFLLTQLLFWVSES
jgi:hypothetical protein